MSRKFLVTHSFYSRLTGMPGVYPMVALAVLLVVVCPRMVSSLFQTLIVLIIVSICMAVRKKVFIKAEVHEKHNSN